MSNYVVQTTFNNLERYLQSEQKPKEKGGSHSQESLETILYASHKDLLPMMAQYAQSGSHRTMIFLARAISLMESSEERLEELKSMAGQSAQPLLEAWEALQWFSSSKKVELLDRLLFNDVAVRKAALETLSKEDLPKTVVECVAKFLREDPVRKIRHLGSLLQKEGTK